MMDGDQQIDAEDAGFMRIATAAAACLLALACLALPWSAGHAETVDGVEVASTIAVDGQVLHLNGAGLRRISLLGIGADIYVAALYLPAVNHDAASILSSPGHKAVMLHFLHKATKEQVQEDFRKGERNNCGNGECNPAELPDFEKLVQTTPAIEVGDTAEYIYDPNRLRVFANGRLICDFNNGLLSHQLLVGFLGQHPPTERLKRELLGLADN